jgi:serpin B
VQAGAEDETRASLGAAFGYPDAPQLYEAMNALLRQLDDVTGGEVILAMSNSGWAQKDRPIGQEYLDSLTRHFGAGLHSVDLQGEPSASRVRINERVAEQTRDRIPDLLPDGFITSDTVYVLVNPSTSRRAGSRSSASPAPDPLPSPESVRQTCKST